MLPTGRQRSVRAGGFPFLILKRVYLPMLLARVTNIWISVPKRSTFRSSRRILTSLDVRAPGFLATLVLRLSLNGQPRPLQRTVASAPGGIVIESRESRAPLRVIVPVSRTTGNGLSNAGPLGAAAGA